MIDKPVRYGKVFKHPSKKTFRLHRAKQGPKLFSRDEILRLIDAAGIRYWFIHRIVVNGKKMGNARVWY